MDVIPAIPMTDKTLRVLLPDGRLYEPQFNQMQNTIYMVGRPAGKDGKR